MVTKFNESTYSRSGCTVLIKDLETIATTVGHSEILTIHIFSDLLCTFSEIKHVSCTKFRWCQLLYYIYEYKKPVYYIDTNC